MTTPTIKFEFTLDEVNGVLAGLAKAPAEFSMFGINLIQKHAGPQVEELRKAQKEEESDEQ